MCGTMFGLKVYRHRKFECSELLLSPPHPAHVQVIGAGRMLNDRDQENEDGWVSLLSKGTLRAASAATGIDWMRKAELTEAIPPAFTEWIGTQLLAQGVAAR